MNAEISNILRNAELLAGLARAFSGDHIVCFPECRSDREPSVSYLARDKAVVLKLYGDKQWHRRRNYSRNYDLVTWRCGVRLVIRDAETVAAPKLEGPIRTVNPTNLCPTPS